VNFWATAANAAVYSTVSIIVGLFVRRSVKRTMERERARIERLLAGFDTVTAIATSTLLENPMTTIDLKRFRKAFAAGFGVLLIGLLTWASSDGVLAGLLEPVVPDAFKPLIGVLVGGIATVVAVIRTANAPAAAPAAAEAVVAAPARVVSTDTSHVELLPVPVPSYL
jgi:hypothetical protein